MIFYIRQAAGYFLQLVPCIVLCMLPFEKKQYRIKRKYFIAVLVPLILVLGVGFAAMFKTVAGQTEKSILLADLYMGCTWIICFLLYLLVIKRNFFIKLMVLCVSIAYGVAMFILENIIQSFLYPNYRSLQIYSWYCFTIYLFLTLCTFPLMILFEEKVLKEYLYESNYNEMKREIFIVTAVTVLYLFTNVVASLFMNQLIWHNILIISFLVFIFTTVVIGVFYYTMFWQIRMIKKRNLSQSLSKIQQLQLKSIQSEIEKSRSIRHDVRQQYRTLRELLAKGELSEMEKLLSEGDEYIVKQSNMHFCREPVLDALLQYYVKMAAEKNINLEPAIRLDSLPIISSELTVLVGNLLENAVKSCLKISGERNIKLNMTKVQNHFLIYMENSCQSVKYNDDPQPDEEGWLGANDFVSMDVGGGYGLKSIEEIVKKYNGQADYKFAPPVFICRIMMNIEEN